MSAATASGFVAGPRLNAAGRLADMGLGSDPFTGNRYAFTGGNPISNVEVDGHFAIKVLRGEEYFVVIQNLAAESVAHLDAAGLVRRIAEAADGLEDRLSRGRDLY